MKRWSIGVASLVCAAALASAQSMTREELQKKADEGKKASCDIVKRQVTARAAICVEEAAAVAKVNCADVKSYKSDELLTLNETCMKKGGRPARSSSAPPAAATPEPTSPPADTDTATSGEGRKCRALIGEEVIMEAEGERLGACLDNLRLKVGELKCKDVAKRTRIEYVMQSLSTSGKRWSEGTPTGVTCR